MTSFPRVAGALMAATPRFAGAYHAGQAICEVAGLLVVTLGGGLGGLRDLRRNRRSSCVSEGSQAYDSDGSEFFGPKFAVSRLGALAGMAILVDSHKFTLPRLA